MVRMARRIIFRHPDTGKIISQKAWEKLYIEGRVEITPTQQSSKAFRKNGQIRSKKEVKRLIKTEEFIDTKPTYTIETIEAEGNEYVLIYDGDPNGKSRKELIEHLMREYKFKEFKTVKGKEARQKQVSLVTFIEAWGK